MSKKSYVVIISPEDKFPHEIERVIQYFEQGLSFFHLRKPTWNKDSLARYIEKIPQSFRQYVILHSHYELVEVFGLKGIHITGKTYSLRDHYVNYDYHLSISTHSFEEIEALGSHYSYAFLSPIYNSISKNNYRTPFTRDSLKFFLSQQSLPCPVVALGGITVDNFSKTLELGFTGGAFLGGAWRKENIILPHG